jgi:perosamine synthetase
VKAFESVIEFVHSLYPCRDFIPLHEPLFAGNEKKYLNECIDSTFVSSVGAFVDQFELKMAEYTGAARAVVCLNGTNALHLALKLAGVEAGNEVITQPLTFIATANAIAYCNARPVFLDVDLDTLGLSPEALLRFLETETRVDPLTGKRINRKTGNRIGACVPMHTFGHPCRISELTEICENYQIPLVEDAAESLGSLYQGKHTGTFGLIGVLSFNGNKILTTGGGGMLLFNDVELAKRAKHLTTQAKVPHPWEFSHDETGYNYRMPNLNAALGLAQLEQLPWFLKSKRETAGKYRDFFADSPFAFVTEPEGARSNYWLNCIRMASVEERDQFLAYSNQNGVMTRPAWNLMNTLPMYKDSQQFDLTNSVRLAETLINLPSSVRHGN